MKAVDEDPLVALLHAAGRAPLPEPNDEIYSASLALRAAENRRRRSRARLIVAAAGLLMAASVLLGWVVFRPTEPGVASMTLPSGDVLLQSALRPASLLVEEVGARRQVRMDEGEVLFDVASLGEVDAFVVRTPAFNVHVEGTVFAVSVDASGSWVEVYEGQVTIRREGQEAEVLATLNPPARFGVGPSWPEAEMRLAETGRERAEQRLLRAQATPASSTTTEPQPSLETSEDDPESVPLVEARSPAPPEADRTSASPRGPTRGSGEPSLSEVRRWLHEGRASDARAAAARREPRDADWARVLGDACRVLRDAECAADAYDRAAAHERPSRATQSGYLAAELRLRHLGDAAGALASLHASGSAAPESPIEERALVLRVEALLQLDRLPEAQTSARRYLLAFPSGPARGRMSAILR